MPEVCRPLLASNPQVLEDLLVSRDLNLVLSEDIWSNPVEFRGYEVAMIAPMMRLAGAGILRSRPR